jgi:hypothetical protein
MLRRHALATQRSVKLSGGGGGWALLLATVLSLQCARSFLLQSRCSYASSSFRGEQRVPLQVLKVTLHGEYQSATGLLAVLLPPLTCLTLLELGPLLQEYQILASDMWRYVATPVLQPPGTPGHPFLRLDLVLVDELIDDEEEPLLPSEELHEGRCSVLPPSTCAALQDPADGQSC